MQISPPSDNEGRWLKLSPQIANYNLTVYNIYGPNWENRYRY